MKGVKLQFAFLVLIILAAAFSRVIPHMYNFSPLGAIGLFGAAHFAHKWKALFIPLAATWLSDLFLNNVIYTAYHPTFTWFYDGFYWQYGSYLLIVLFGLLLFNQKISATRTLFGALGAGAIFFLVTNFGEWAAGIMMYPKTISGLTACYAAAIPFYWGTLLGDLFYTSVLFGGYYLLQKRFAFFRLPHLRYA